MFIEVIPTGAAIGAEIRGVNLAHPLDDATFAKVEEAYNTHGVIFFRNQRLTPPQQVAFTRCFGEIELNIFGERWSVPGNPQIVVVSNVTEGGRAVGVRRAGENWHSDVCYTAQPPRGNALRNRGPRSLPARRRRGRRYLILSATGSTGGTLYSISRAASVPSLPLNRRLIGIHR